MSKKDIQTDDMPKGDGSKADGLKADGSKNHTTTEALPYFDTLLDALSYVNQSNISHLENISFKNVTGGDINELQLVTLPNGNVMFVKQNSLDNLSLLKAEAVGLRAIQATGARICHPKAYGKGNERDCSFLILSAINRKHPTSLNKHEKEAGWTDLAHQLITLHQAKPPQPRLQQQLQSADNSHNYQAGWHDDNFIGYSIQKNNWMTDWHEFFATCRLEYQTKLAFDNGYLDNQTRRQIEYLQNNLSNYLPSYTLKDDNGQPRPSLLHGDLWSGNKLIGNDFLNNETQSRQDIFGYLIDPAVYVGHPETDLAMTQMFGGFDSLFYDTYAEHMPITSDFTERVDIYNLYHYLNHLNLFGTAYLASVKRIAGRFG